MAITRTPTYIHAKQNRDLVRSFSYHQTVFQRQLSTGRKVQELINHKANLPIVQNVRNDLNATTRLINGIDKTIPVLDSYKTAIEALISHLEELKKVATQNSSDFDTWESITKEPTESILVDFRALLNEKHGERYIFSGLRFETPPVSDTNTPLTALPNFIIPRADVVADNITFAAYVSNTTTQEVAMYDTDFAITTVPDAFRGLSQALNYGAPKEYTINSNNETFQKIFHTARLILSAAELSDPDDYTLREKVILEAFTNAKESLDELRLMRDQNDIKRKIFLEARKQHTGKQQSLQILYDKLVNIESSQEVTIQLATLNNRIEASYAAMIKRDQLSLVNYLR